MCKRWGPNGEVEVCCLVRGGLLWLVEAEVFGDVAGVGPE